MSKLGLADFYMTRILSTASIGWSTTECRLVCQHTLCFV